MISLNILILKKIPHTDRQTDRPTDIWPYRSDLPSLKNKTNSTLYSWHRGLAWENWSTEAPMYKFYAGYLRGVWTNLVVISS